LIIRSLYKNKDNHNQNFLYYLLFIISYILLLFYNLPNYSNNHIIYIHIFYTHILIKAIIFYISKYSNVLITHQNNLTLIKWLIQSINLSHPKLHQILKRFSIKNQIIRFQKTIHRHHRLHLHHMYLDYYIGAYFLISQTYHHHKNFQKLLRLNLSSIDTISLLMYIYSLYLIILNILRRYLYHRSFKKPVVSD